MIDKLMDFGLSRLEALGYIALLQEPGITGYRLSHILNKPTANVYKALKSLENKGLVEMDNSSGSQSIHPVSIEEFLHAREIQFKAKSLELKESLKDLGKIKEDYQISRLGSFEQTVSKALQIIKGAENILVVVAFKEVLVQLEQELMSKAKMGLEVFIYTYTPYELKGCKVLNHHKDSELWNSIPERAFDVAADGKSFLISNFRNNYSEVIEALYGNHTYLSLMIFNSLSKNILLQEMREGDFFSPEAKEEFEQFFNSHKSLLLENLPEMKSFFEKHQIPVFEARV